MKGGLGAGVVEEHPALLEDAGMVRIVKRLSMDRQDHGE